MRRAITGKIRVLQIIHTSGITGPGRILLGTAKYLDRREFQVDVLCPPEGPLADGVRKLGLEVVPFDYSRCGDAGYLLRTAEELRHRDYHVFHIHSGQLTGAARIMGVLLRIPVVVQTEHLVSADHSWIRGVFRRGAHLLGHWFANVMVDRVIAVSVPAARAFLERQGMRKDKVVVIPNGIDREDVRSGGRDTLADTIVVGCAGRLSVEKGYGLLVQAAREFARVPGIQVIITGEGPGRADLQQLIAGLGLEGRVILAGFQEDIYSFLAKCDIFVQPSFDQGESFGLAGVEAMAAGTAVISSDIDVFRAITDDGRNGLLFRAGDPADLAAKIMRLVEDPGLRRRVAAQGREDSRKYDVAVTAARTGDLYAELLAVKGFLPRGRGIAALNNRLISFLRAECGSEGAAEQGVGARTEGFLRWIAERPLTPREVSSYLDSGDGFLAEMGVRFLRGEAFGRERVTAANLRLVAGGLKAREVTARDYDDRVSLQSTRFQVDNYFDPVDPLMRARVAFILERLCPREGERILDAGCGVGTFAYHCARKGCECVGLDYSALSIASARRVCAERGVAARFEQCDVCARIPFPDGYFDKIVAADFIEHITAGQKASFLAEAWRVLKPGGQMVVFTPNGIREWIGAAKTWVGALFGAARPETRLHFGLTDRFSFERLLRRAGFLFTSGLCDLSRPYLVRIPVANELLSLNLIWVARKARA